jgi:ribosome-binding protein aMBF1 (putative translation factor)
MIIVLSALSRKEAKMETLQGRVGAYLAQNRVKKGDLAKQLNMTTLTLNRKTSGENELLFSEAKKLSEILGIGLDDLYKLSSH